MRAAWLGLLVLGSSACEAVYVDRPIGGDPVTLDPEEWEGTWVAGEDAITFRVLTADSGILRLGWVEDEEGEFVLGRALLHLRDAGERVLATLVQADDDPERHLWVLLVRRGESLVAFEPEVDRFRHLVEQGRLPGRLGEGSDENVYLKGLGPRHLDLILSEAEGFLFDLDEPMVLTRLPR
jgi:hypothetical protein